MSAPTGTTGLGAVALVVAVVWPLALAAALPLLAARERLVRALLPTASAPALLLALIAPASLDLDWLLLGARLDNGGPGRALLLLVGLVWTAAGWFAASRLRERVVAFALFWLVALWGIVVAALAADLVSFYLGYATMTLAGYGLVVHAQSDEARRAGRVYLTMAIAAELAVLCGLLLLGARVGNAPLGELEALVAGGAGPAGWFLAAGFAVKIGLVPLHVWLPLAHPVAPVPASAILSGVIVKAGVLGVLVLAPAGAFGDRAPVALGVTLGLFTAFYAVVVGLTQSRLKTVLAYSTVSQMGLLAAAVALALAGAAERAAALPLVALFVLHHGLNKAALFLAAGSSPGASRWRMALLGASALALAGAPLTSGALAKTELKALLAAADLPGAALILLALSSAATTLLMLKVWHLGRAEREPGRLHPAWPILVAAGLLVPWLSARDLGAATLPDLAGLWASTWPIALALGLAWTWRALRLRAGVVRIPEGDLLVPIERALAPAVALVRRLRMPRPELRDPGIAAWLARVIGRGERALGRLSAAGLALLCFIALLWLALG